METDRIWVERISPLELLERAREASLRSYAPYSRFKVGSALLLKGGRVLLGCNVENASYGLSMCAERSVLAAMVAQGLENPFAIAVSGFREGKEEVFCSPCGACRQVLMEFNPEMFVVLASEKEPAIFRAAELLPFSFSLKYPQA